MATKKSSRTNPFLFDIGRLWGSAEGTTEKHNIKVKPVFAEAPGFEAVSDISADLTFIKMKGAISAIIENLDVDIKFSCSKCLKDLVEGVTVTQAEREFRYAKEHDDPLRDIFYIDTHEKTIDLAEAFRQEIILHFPLIPVCSKRCKGLCPVCGKDRNKTLCKCKPESEEINQPFKNLKKLIKK